MTNSRAKGGDVKLATYTAGSADATETFTINADMDTLYREIILVMEGQPTAALELRAVINGIATTKNSTFGFRQTTSAHTQLSLVSAGAYLVLATTTTLSASSRHISVKLTLSKGIATTWAITGQSSEQSGGGTLTEHLNHLVDENGATQNMITTITISTSTSTWIAGTTINIYGILK